MKRQDAPELGPALDFDTVVAEDASSTILPSPEPRPGGHDVASLPRLRLSGDRGQVEFELDDELGHGGMGVVLGAHQVALGRRVALKTLPEGRINEFARRSLLEEAWVIGSLEHPNIVPIYTLGRSDDDRPMIVMKRIEGRTWREILDNEDRPLEWHLDMLLQVCRALEFAHHRGIVHRDLKPENVMRGNFGEVYLLDWGVAVSTRDDDTGRFSSARDCQHIAGTPHYMAPEMAASGTPVDERTDVYLLGALLHELVTGSAPHQGRTVPAVLLAAYQSEPHEYPSEVPRALADVCLRAMRREPADRFAEVADLRHAVEDYLERRASVELADDATTKLAALRKATAFDAEDPRHQAKVRELFGQCHFGFDSALRVWPDNPEAKEGREVAFAIMTQWEIDTGNVVAAEASLHQLENPDDELVAGVRRLREQHDEQHAELEEHRREQDLRVAAKVRVRLGVAVAIFFSVLPFAIGAAIRSGVMEHPSGPRSVALSFILLIFVSLFRFFGRSLSANLINRRIVNVILLCAICLPVIRLVGVLRGIDVMDVLAFEMVLFGLGAAAVAVIASSTMYLGAVAYFAGAVVSALIPHHTLEVFGVTNAVVGTVMVFALRPPPVTRESAGSGPVGE